jgi:fatty acid desaturase
VTWQTVLIGGLTWAIGWWAYPVLWLVPVYVFTFLGDNFRSFAEHSHPAPDREMNEHRLITFLSNPVERWFVAPMNMNYHAAHHLYPSIPYYHLATADQEMRQSPAASGLIWRRSYFGYLASYFRALPLDECREELRIVDGELQIGA